MTRISPLALHQRSLRILFAIVVTAALAACSQPVRQTQTDTPQVESFAELAFQQGRYQEAGDVFAYDAERGGRATSGLRLRAAQSYLRAGLPGLADAQLANLRSLRRGQSPEAELLLTAIAIERNQGPAQPTIFERYAVTDFDEMYQPDYWQWLARYRALSDDLSAAARAWLERETLLRDPQLVRDNERQVFKTLLRLPAEQARTEADGLAMGDPLLPWLTLSAAVKTSLLEGTSPEEAINEWQIQYPDHPGAELVALELGIGADEAETRTGPVAVLIPTSGPLAFAGAAIRDGLIAAWLESPEPRAEIEWFDTASDAGRAVRAYNIAVERGAAFVIGPLDRGALRAVAREAENYEVPVIGLNTLEWDRPEPSEPEVAEDESADEVRVSEETMVDETVDKMDNDPATEKPKSASEAPIFQFALNPEDEARAIAKLMLAQGHTRALALVPSDDWGNRLVQAFADSFESDGGTVISAAGYDATASDHGAVLRQLLGLDASASRHRTLSRKLGRELGFEPKRRGDVDALFMGARVRQARLMKPQLRFHHAVGLPVYATSHVFAGTTDPTIDRDMEGVYFTDSPWLLDAREYRPTRRQAADASLKSQGSGARLFALGMDAWRILPYLSWLGYSGESYPGATGDLRVDRNGEIHRTPAFAQFRSGMPKLVELPEPDLETDLELKPEPADDAQP